MGAPLWWRHHLCPPLPQVGKWPTGHGEDSWRQNCSQGSQGECRVSCDSSKGGEGPKEACTVWEEQHGGEGRHPPQRPGRHRQHCRHWSGDHRQSQCPGGQQYRHWSGDHRQSHCLGGPRQPQHRWAMRDRHATHQCTGQKLQRQAPLNREKTAMVKTAEEGKAPLNRSDTAKSSPAEQGTDRHGKAPLNREKTAMVKTAEQGKALLNRSDTAKSSTAEQGTDRHGKALLNREKTAMVKTAEQGKAPLNRSDTAKSSTAEQGKDRHGEDC
ncbi:hypothetical protein NDU88_000593 [Pleurodeles waltl]|uniref:Uncharacterized protein n=1 Tax=Pleurodeles waltl TaxID=8319 RepID=A0AAV7P5E6_PLEWA|nr:hypothetical protein NDU88_000593 [Pleurodeles waltl]